MSLPPAEVPGRSAPRRAEVLAALSLAIDLGLGLPMEHMLRSVLIATRMADRLGLTDVQREVVYYANLVAWIGCHADSHEVAGLLGDDIAFRADSYQVDWIGVPFRRLVLDHATRGKPVVERVGVTASLLLGGHQRLASLLQSHCSSAGELADRIGLGDRVGRVLAYTFERWDGHGLPAGVQGKEIPLEMRIVRLAEVAEVYLQQGGVKAATRMALSRRGTQFDPELVDLLVGNGGDLLSGLPDGDCWEAALAQAPDWDRGLSEVEMDQLLVAIGDFVDLKCPCLIGHSRGVAALAVAAGRRSGLSTEEIRTLRWAGLVHDLGRMGVSNAIWEKPGRLSDAEWERVRLHPYLTGRILNRVPALRAVAQVAASHHERQDGSGYPAGVEGAGLSSAQRLLAAADVYQAFCQPRPFRPALEASQAARELRVMVQQSLLDGSAVEAVLTAAGQQPSRRTSGPAELTAREVEILRLVALGEPNRVIAAQLHIAEKTVRNHVEHIYAKLNIRNRTGASLFAVRHGLVPTFPGLTEKT